MLLFFSILIAVVWWSVCRRLFRQEMTGAGLLLMLQMVYQYFAVEFDLGPASLRIYNIILLSILACGVVLTSQQRQKYPGAFLLMLVCEFGFLFWTVGCVLLRNEFGPGYLTSLLGVYIYAPVICFCLVTLIRSRGELIGVTTLLIFIALVNAVAGVGQWFEYDRAWDLFRTIRPQSALDRLVMEMETPELGQGYVPGLQVNSIDLSFVLLFGILAFGYLLRDGVFHRSKSGFFWLAINFVFAAGVVVSLSRSSLLVYGIVFVMGLPLVRYAPNIQSTFVSRFAGMFVLVGGIICGAMWVIRSGGFSENFSTHRLTSLEFVGRLDLWTVAVTAISDAPLSGVGISTYMRNYSDGQAPHSFLLSAGVYYGVVGIIFMLVLMSLLALQTRAIVVVATGAVRAGERAVSHIAIAACMGVWAYVIKSMFHNNSFATGGIIGWMFIGLAVAAHRILMQRGSRSNPAHGRRI